MVSVYTLGQLSCQLAAKTQHSLSIGYPMASNSHPNTCDQVQSVTTGNSEVPAHRQWPWRSFAFCSDLGTVGYLVNKPKLGLLGWVLALPYYLYALFKQPKGEQRKQEFIYQTTANGIFPFTEAKLGVVIGDLIDQHLITPLIKKYPTSAFSRLTQPMSKIAGGLIALLALTPTMGDPVSHWIMQKYKTHLREG